MNREEAVKYLRIELDKYDLNHWHIRLNQNLTSGYLGLCSHKDKCIILNAHHIDTNPDHGVIDTILHEVAHALTEGHGHDEVWQNKALELGCQNPSPCSSYSISPEIVDAIRSGANVEVTYKTETIHRPVYKVTKLQDKCDVCEKVAVEKFSQVYKGKDFDRKFITLTCGHITIKKIPKATPFGSLISNWWRENVQNCQHDFVNNKCILCKETKLFPFQVEGARFLEVALATQHGGAIFDEMGLGKTVQALATLKYLTDYSPVLFVVKSGIKYQWFKEILKWLGPTCIAQIIESSKDYVIPNLKCYIASYDIFVARGSRKPAFDIEKFDFIKSIVLDEVQQIKNPDSSRTQAIRKLARDKKVIALSGTPWKNRGSEFFTILNMLNPMLFHSHAAFVRNWVDIYFDGKYSKQGGISDIPRFKQVTKDILIRREVVDVMKEMPSVQRTLHFTNLDKLEQQEYDNEVSEFVKWYNEKVIGGEEDSFENSGNILAKLARMRHITGLAKIPATMEFVKEFESETDRKLVIFVHHKDVGEILFGQLKNEFNKTIEVYKLTADMNPQDRFKTAEAFQNSKRSFMVASTLASGEGINLQTCADAIIHERQWNPQNEDQAAPGRFRRIGSEFSRVNVTFMTAAATVDELLANIVERKREYFHNAMNNSEMPTFNQGNFTRELAEGIVDEWNKKNRLTKMSSLK